MTTTTTTTTTLPLLLLLLLLLLFHPSLSSTMTPSNACNLTIDPPFCRSILPPSSPQNLFFFGRFSLAKSLLHTYEFLAKINEYLAFSSSSLSPSAVMALQDCQLLLNLNVDFLSSASSTLNFTTSLPDSQADSFQSTLSAVLTNQETCYEGLYTMASTIENALYGHFISNGSKLYSLSLAFFNHAWIPYRTVVAHQGIPRAPGSGTRKLLFHEVELGKNGELPLRMSENDRKIYEMRTRRRLLQQAVGGGVNVSEMVVVSQDGSGNFTTITDAVNSAPNNTDGSSYFLIIVNGGVYEEYVSISKKTKYVMMVGAGINQTVVTGSHNNADGWTTFNSATFAVVGQGFVAVNMTFRNTAGAIKNQAVAVRCDADLSTFYFCSFEGYQDTLYTHSLRQFYRNCDIYGTVDFIFGNAAVVFQDCNIYPRLPISGQSNTITAQGRTDPNQNTGTSVQNCTVVSSAELAANNGTTNTYLGRPWKNYSRTVVMESFLDSVIDPAGWLAWDGTFALSTLYYAEYSNTGPGSDTSNRVTWPGYHVIGSSDAINFTVSNFLLGDIWLPKTGVSYTTGLN